MSDEMDPPGISPEELLAMDVAMGALGRDERRAAELRQRSDPAFRALVEDWTARLSPLDEATAQVLPPASVWQGITDEITPAKVAPQATAKAATPGASWWNNLAIWRGLALAGTAAAVIAVAQIGPAPDAPGAPPQMLVAALAAPDGTPLLSAAYDPIRGAVVLTPATQRDETGDKEAKSAELWVIEGKNPPRSLGVIDIKGPNAHAITTQQLTGLQSGATLAISIEPYGGSPTGQPTGPVVATGTLRAI